MKRKSPVLIALFVLFVFLSFVLIPVSALTDSDSPSQGKNQFVEQFCELDIVAAAVIHVKTVYTNEDFPGVFAIEPLYNLSNDVVAHKLYMTDNSYIVINAKKENPVVIEFSDPGVVSSRDLDRLMLQNRRYYVAPGIIFDEKDIFGYGVNEQVESFGSFNDIQEMEFAFNKMLSTPNEKLTALHNEALQFLTNYVDNELIRGNTKNSSIQELYDFLVDEYDLPIWESYYYKYLRGVENITNWGTTGEFSDLANNHCAATSAFNVTHYYRTRFGDPIVNSDRLSVFEEIHSFICDGPVTPLEYRARYRSYVSVETSYNVSIVAPAFTWANYKSYIHDGYVVLMCVWPELLSAHMINGVGYREYPSGNYCAVLDNWNSSGMVYTLFGEELFSMFCIKLTE